MLERYVQLGEYDIRFVRSYQGVSARINKKIT